MDALPTKEHPPGTIDRAARRVHVVDPLWRAARLWTAALVLALFPVLFIVDRAIETPLSPVLPGLAFFFLLIVGLPFLFLELAQRRYRRKDLAWQALHAARWAQNGRAALVLAGVWLALWFAVGT